MEGDNQLLLPLTMHTCFLKKQHKHARKKKKRTQVATSSQGGQSVPFLVQFSVHDFSYELVCLRVHHAP